MNRCRLRPAIVDRDEHEDVLSICLGVFDEDVEVAIVVEDASIEQLELRLVFAATTVLIDQPRVRELSLWILVKHLQVGMCRRGVEIVVKFLGVLAVIALAVCQTKEPLLQNRVLAVPKRKRETKTLLIVADAGQTVFAPAIRTAAGMIVRQVFPCVAVRAVIFTHCAPLAFREVRTPEFPVFLPGGVLFEAKLL